MIDLLHSLKGCQTFEGGVQCACTGTEDRPHRPQLTEAVKG